MQNLCSLVQPESPDGYVYPYSNCTVVVAAWQDAAVVVLQQGLLHALVQAPPVIVARICGVILLNILSPVITIILITSTLVPRPPHLTKFDLYFLYNIIKKYSYHNIVHFV